MQYICFVYATCMWHIFYIWFRPLGPRVAQTGGAKVKKQKVEFILQRAYLSKKKTLSSVPVFLFSLRFFSVSRIVCDRKRANNGNGLNKNEK